MKSNNKNIMSKKNQDFNYEDLYKINFSKIVGLLSEENKLIIIEKNIVDKNQLLEFIKSSNINIEDFKILRDKQITYKTKIFFLNLWNQVETFFKETLSKFTKKDNTKEIDTEKDNLEKNDLDLRSFDGDSNSKKEFKDKKEKKEWKFPNSLVIIIGILFFFIFLTWVIPHEGYVDNSGGTDIIWNAILNRNGGEFDSGKFGIIDSTYAIMFGFYEALPIILYLFALGALLQILVDTGTFERGIGSTLKKLKDKEIIVIPILFIMFSSFGTIWGMQEEAIPYYSIMVPFMILSGFSPVSAIMIMMLGNTTGMMASVTNPFSPGVAISALDPVWNGNVTMGSGILIRFLIWITLTTAGAIFVTRYAIKHSKKEDPNFCEEHKNDYIAKVDSEINIDEYEIKTLEKKQIWSLSIFGLTILTIIIGIIPWSFFDGNSFGFFPPYLSTFFAEIGHWGFIELTTVLFFGIILQILIHGPRKYQWTNILMDGARGMLGVSIIIAIARGASVVLIYSGLSATFVNGLSHLPGQDTSYGFLMFVALSSLIIGTAIPSTSGSATILFPLISGLIANGVTDPALISGSQITLMVSSIAVFSMCLGLTNMFSPAQAVLLASTEYSGLTYTKYMKEVWGFVLMQFLIMIVIIIPILSLL